MTEDSSTDNLRRFLDSDDPAKVLMGLSMAKGIAIDDQLQAQIFVLAQTSDQAAIKDAAAGLYKSIVPQEFHSLIDRILSEDGAHECDLTESEKKYVDAYVRAVDKRLHQKLTYEQALWVVQSLIGIKTEAATDVLIKIIRSSDLDGAIIGSASDDIYPQCDKGMLQVAAYELGARETVRAIPVLLKFDAWINGEREDEYGPIAWMGEVAIPELIRIWSDEDSADRERVPTAMGALVAHHSELVRNGDLLDIMTNALEDDDSDIRENAARGAAKFPEKIQGIDKRFLRALFGVLRTGRSGYVIEDDALIALSIILPDDFEISEQDVRDLLCAFRADCEYEDEVKDNVAELLARFWGDVAEMLSVLLASKVLDGQQEAELLARLKEHEVPV